VETEKVFFGIKMVEDAIIPLLANII